MSFDIVGNSQVGGSGSWGTFDAGANAAALGDPNLIATVAYNDPTSFGGGAAAGSSSSGATVGGAWSPEPAGNNAIFDGTYSANQGFTVPATYASMNYGPTAQAPATTTPATTAGGAPDAAAEAAKKKSAEEAAKKAAAAEAAKKAEPAPAPAAQTVTVKSGDTLSAIGSRTGVAWKEIYEANKGVIGGNPNMIRPGQVLTIP